MGVDFFPGDAIGRAVDCAFCTHNPAHVRSRSTAGSEFRVSADELTIPGCTAVRCAGNESPSGQAITNLRVGRPNGDICGSFFDDEGPLSGWLIWRLGSSEQETGEKKTSMRKHGLPRPEKRTGKGQKATKLVPGQRRGADDEIFIFFAVDLELCLVLIDGELDWGVGGKDVLFGRLLLPKLIFRCRGAHNILVTEQGGGGLALFLGATFDRLHGDDCARRRSFVGKSERGRENGCGERESSKFELHGFPPWDQR